MKNLSLSKIILLIILFFTVLLIISIIALNNFINHKLFIPTHDILSFPKVPYEDIDIKVNDHETINLWKINLDNHNGKKAKTVLFCHGNYGNISHRNFIVDLCKKIKVNLILFDYRGYGKSKGKANINTICHDAILVYNYLVRDEGYDPNKLIVWGESLGGAPAINLAATCKIDRLIIMSSFSSINDIVLFRKDMKYYHYPCRLLTNFIKIFPNSQHLKKVDAPVIIFHSKEDEIIPFKCAKVNYNSISHRKKVLIEIGGTHSIPIINDKNIKELLCFCDIELIDEKNINSWLRDFSVCIRRQNDFFKNIE